MCKARFLPSLHLLLFVSLVLASCKDAGELLDLAKNPPKRERIDAARMGLNNFFVDENFGSIEEQYREIRDELGIKHIRILLAWTDAVQPSPSAEANYSFFDKIIRSAPEGVDLLVVLAHCPSWMRDSSNWIGNNPRRTWIERWLRPTVMRYRADSELSGPIVGWEVWNEPNLSRLTQDTVLGLDQVANYVELLNYAHRDIRRLDPGRLIVLAASESINQRFPENLNYNKELRRYGAEKLVDVWNIHYYSTNFESLVASGGVADFLNDLPIPVWITESGERGPTNQLSYVETAWPFLRKEAPGIDRIYYYEFSSSDALDENYGLKNNSPDYPTSDLYNHLFEGRTLSKMGEFQTRR